MTHTSTDVAYHSNSKPVAYWLLACALMVCLMVAVGGLTRLTESGLSITEWKPVSGILPPLNQQEWETEFSGYRQSPEYHHKNYGMSLDEFKQIFWLEYIHRVLGRLAGGVFFLPLLYFWIKGYVRGELRWQLPGTFLLGGLQGLVGWLMVASGLKDQPNVSPYWLSFHLGTATVILTLLLVRAFTLIYHKRRKDIDARCYSYLKSLLVLVFIQMMFGAFVAGLDAGLVYNTFPDMGGEMVPSGLFPEHLGVLAIFEDVTTVQFFHRVLAFVVLCGVLFVSAACYVQARRISLLLGAIVVVQFALGVLTIVGQVPVVIASMHQVGAFILYSTLVWALCQRKPRV